MKTVCGRKASRSEAENIQYNKLECPETIRNRCTGKKQPDCKPLSSNKEQKVRLEFAKKYRDEPRYFWNQVMERGKCGQTLRNNVRNSP